MQFQMEFLWSSQYYRDSHLRRNFCQFLFPTRPFCDSVNVRMCVSVFLYSC